MNIARTETEAQTIETVKFITRRALVSMTTHDTNGPVLFLPSAAQVRVGQTTRVKVAFSDCNKSFIISGQVKAKQDALAGAPSGFDLIINGPDDRRAWAVLYGFCTRNQSGARRFRSVIDCSVETTASKCDGLIKDVSMTGAFIALRQKHIVAIGAPVTIAVKGGLFGLGAMKLKAEIVWAGQKDTSYGVGAVFTDDAPKIIALLKKNGLGGV